MSEYHDDGRVSSKYAALCEQVQRKLRALPDRGAQKYAEVEEIFRTHAGEANSYIDEGCTHKAVQACAADGYKLLRQNAADALAMDPKDYDMLVSMRMSNAHAATAEKLARRLRAVAFSMDGGEYPEEPRIRAVD